jgi:hypothetical protein
MDIAQYGLSLASSFSSPEGDIAGFVATDNCEIYFSYPFFLSAPAACLVSFYSSIYHHPMQCIDKPCLPRCHACHVVPISSHTFISHRSRLSWHCGCVQHAHRFELLPNPTG